MAGLDMNNFIPTPIKDAMDVERIQGAQYQNMLTQQAMQQEAEKRRGYESAYQNMLAQQQMPQQQQQMKTVEPTPELAKLGYGSFQAQPEQQVPQQVQHYQAPAGSSYGYIQGAEQQNALAQKQQIDYYSQRIEPALNFAIASGDNSIKERLIEQVNAFDSPQAGLARDFLNLIKDVNISAPGQLDNVKISPKLKEVLVGMAPNEVVAEAIRSSEDGSVASVKMNRSGQITEFGAPKLTAGSQPKWQRKKYTKTDEADGKVYEYTVDFNPITREEVEVSKVPIDSKALFKRRYSKYNEAGVLMDSWTGKLIYPEKDAKGNLTYPSLSAQEATDLGLGAKTQGKATQQIAGPKTAALDRGLELFKDSAPKLISLKETLSQQDRDRLLPLVTSSKTWNEFSSKLENAVSDNPDLADLQKSTTLLADSLAAVYGAGPGGQWSFEVAKAMLDPNMGMESFKRTLASHQHKLENSLSAAKSFGSRLPSTKEVRESQQPKAGQTKSPKIPTTAKLIGTDKRTQHHVYGVTKQGKTFYFDGVTGEEIK